MKYLALKNLVFLLILSCSPLIGYTQNNVIYVNGIQNTIIDADDTRITIRDTLNISANHQGNRKVFSVTGVWNPMGWSGTSEGSDLSQDLMELFLMKTSEELFSADFLQIVRPANNRTPIDSQIARRVAAFLTDMTPGSNSLETNNSIDDEGMRAIQNAILNLVTRINRVGTATVVAHSQGNLLANLAYARLASDGFDVPNKLRIVNVANTSEFSASGLNFTHAGDAAIFSSATALLLKDQSIETLPSQFTNWNVPGVVIVGNTLRAETREAFYTPAHYLERWDSRLRQRDREREAAELVTQAEVSPRDVQVWPTTSKTDMPRGAFGTPEQFGFDF